MKRRGFMKLLGGVPLGVAAASLGIAALPVYGRGPAQDALSSIWSVTWDTKHAHHIFPKHMTATEIAARHNEKLVQLGPILERLQDEMFEPLHNAMLFGTSEVERVPESAVHESAIPLLRRAKARRRA